MTELAFTPLGLSLKIWYFLYFMYNSALQLLKFMLNSKMIDFNFLTPHTYMILITSLFMHYLYMSVNKIDVTLTFCSSPCCFWETFMYVMPTGLQNAYNSKQKQGNTLS